MSSYAGVSVFYAHDGEDWAGYLRSKLGSKDYAIHSELNNIRDDPDNHTRSTVVNTFLMSPDFLDLNNWNIMKEFNPKTSLAILAGIDFQDLKRESKKKECKEVLGWLIYELTDSENEQKRNESVRNMLLMIVAAYEGALQDDVSGHLRLRRTVSAMDRGSRTTQNVEFQGALSPQSDYDVLPPKRQVNGLHTCVVADDKLFVILHRAAEGKVQIEFSDGSITPADLHDPAYAIAFPYLPQDRLKSFQITLDGRNIGGNKSISNNESDSSRHSDSYIVQSAISETRNASDTTVGDNDKIPHTEKRTLVDVGVQTETNNNETIQLEETNRLSAKTEKDRESHSSKLDQIYDLLKDELDPEMMLCRCLGIANDINVLDDKLKSLAESTEAFKHISYPVECEPIEDRSSSTWPTLLHFGAQYNLLNFCDVLLSNPLMHGACLTRNRDNYFPHDLARRHGHTELSVLLKHFSTYVSGVSRDGLYDSGFSGGTPRLSTITIHRDSRDSHDSIPRPHHSRDVSRGYTHMGSKLLGEAISEFTAAEEEAEKQATCPKLTKDARTISDDVGFEEDDDGDFETIVDENRASSSPSNNSGDENDEPFGNLMTYSLESSRITPVPPRRISKDSITSNESKSSFYLDEEESGEFGGHRKDIKSFLGTEEVQSTPPERKGFFSTLFGTQKKKKSRSSSEPSLSVVTEKTKVYKRGSNRSSSTSTSSGSSTNIHESKSHEETAVQYRDADAQKSKNKLRLFMSKAKAERRKSIRMKNVLEDKNMSGPTLPPRRRQIQETF